MEVNSSDIQLCAEVCAKGDHFWRTGLLSDCKFLVGQAPRQEIISSHKLLLSMASPVFETMCCGSIPENGIPVVDIQPETFKLLLEYIYKGSLNTNSIDDVCNLCYAAKKFTMQPLLTKCFKYLCKKVDTGNVLKLLTFAMIFKEESLLESCKSIICWNTHDILNTKDFESVHLDVAKYIFSLDTLNISSELELIEAAGRYAMAQDNNSIATLALPPNDRLLTENNHSESQTLGGEPVTENNESSASIHSDKTNEIVDSSSTAAANTPKHLNTMSKIRCFVRKIRFLTLTPRQFAECSSRTLIMTSREATAVIFNIASENTNIPMPSSFTMCRSARHYVMGYGTSGSAASRAMATIRFEIRDAKNLSKAAPAESPPFYVRNVPWTIKVGQSTNKTYLKVYLYCKPYNTSLSWSCEAEVQLCLISENLNISKNYNILFTKRKSRCGHRQFMAWTDVLDPAKGFLNNGAITVEVHIVTKEPHVVW